MEASVGRLHRFDHGVEDTSVPHHVWVGEVETQKVRLPRCQGLDRLVRQLIRRHLGLQIVGGHLGAGRHGPLLPVKRRFSSSTEEERDVRILLRLCHAELRLSFGADHLSEGVGQVGLVVQHMHTLESLVVIGHGDVVQVQWLHAMLGESLLGQRLGDFSAAVGAEIEAQHHVSRSDASVNAIHQKRLHKFVGHPTVVMCLHPFNRGSKRRIALPE